MKSDITAISMLSKQSEMKESEKDNDITKPIMYQFNLI